MANDLQAIVNVKSVELPVKQIEAERNCKCPEFAVLLPICEGRGSAAQHEEGERGQEKDHVVAGCTS
jgi:hypothetical protein